MRVPLTRGFWALVDVEDYPRVAEHSWCILDQRKSRNGLVYAQSRIQWETVYLHRFVMRATAEDQTIDHDNHDGLDCRKCNLIVKTDAQNKRNRRGLASHNKSGVTNVFWDKSKKHWHSEIQVDNRKVYVGGFSTVKAAVAARDAAKVEHGY
jgi:hypothetical protein